jgi:hypothetical protein
LPSLGEVERDGWCLVVWDAAEANDHHAFRVFWVLGCEVQLWVFDGCCRLWQRLPPAKIVRSFAKSVGPATGGQKPRAGGMSQGVPHFYGQPMVYGSLPWIYLRLWGLVCCCGSWL